MTFNVDDPFQGIVECPEHPTGTAMDEDCDVCTGEFGAKKAVLDDMADAVQQALNALADMKAAPDPAVITSIRLELLIESMLRDRNRVHFECEVGRRVLLALQEMEGQVRKDMLGGSVTKLFVPPSGVGGKRPNKH